jgi:hypothetical protein
VIPWIIIGTATAITLWVSRYLDETRWLAAAAALSVLSLPAVEEPHFVLMAIPLALLPLDAFELAIIGALLIVPLEFTSERFTNGWWALLAYPRLYGAWLLWFASIRAPRSDAQTAGQRELRAGT